MNGKDPKPETVAIHGGGRSGDGDVTQPIHLSTTFERAEDGEYYSGYVYTRQGNPNRKSLEATLAALDGGVAAAAFASGSAAASVLLRSLLKPGDHALIPDDMYHGVRKLFLQVLQPWGVRVTRVDMTDLDAVASAIGSDTRLIWVETPSNPLLKVTDVEAVAELAHGGGAKLVCDATWTPARLLSAFDLGADLLVHSTTKYLSGHSDVLGGAVVAREPGGVFERVRLLQESEGAVPSPFDCWLTLRGIKTLPYRIKGHLHNAEAVAGFLDSHPGVIEVLYPGLPSHRGHEIAKRQMKGFGGMMSFRVEGGEEAAMAVAARVQLITRATSLGGVESLIEHRASVEGSGSLTPRDLLRLSVGLEHPEDLIEDLDQALGAAS